jgi:two-component system chemotaxis response regulator CheB
MQEVRNLIVIGASAGGFEAIAKVISGFSPNDEAAVIVVIHMSRKSNSRIIADMFSKSTSLHCLIAAEGMPIERGHLYVALTDHHVMVKGNELLVRQGPHENRYRPSIDVLFRSAAVNFGNRTIGIILSGLLDDGTSGMWAIKQAGGLCIVQNPLEAQFSSMPRSVLNKIEVDYIEYLEDIPDVLKNIINNPLPPEKAVPVELQIEADITNKMMSDIDNLKAIAERSDFVCPECGGGLWHVKNDPVQRYRCHTGHVYTEKLLEDLQDEKIEESIWVSIRMLEEKSNLLHLMAKRDSKGSNPESVKGTMRRVEEMDKHISRLKSLLHKFNEDADNPPDQLPGDEVTV